MRVSLVGPVYPFRGGIAHYTSHLTLALRSQGHSCKVFSFRRLYPSFLYPGGSDKDPSENALQVDADFLIDSLNPITWLRTSQQILLDHPNLVILQWWTTFLTLPFAVMARQITKREVPVVYLVHNIFPHEVKPWDRWLVRFALSPARGFIVQTQQEQQRLISVLPDAISVVSPHPVYSMLSGKCVEKNKARQALGLPLDQPILLFFGIVRPYKGLNFLIDALSILKKEGIAPILIVAGDFWHARSIYEQQIESLGLTSQVRLDDRYIPDDHAALLFSAADCLVAPYGGGTQSGVAGLALGCGLPIIASDLVAEGLSEKQPDTLIVVPRADAIALAHGIRTFLTRPAIEPRAPAVVPDNWWKLVNAIEELTGQLAQGA